MKVWCFPILFVQSPKVNTHLKRRYSLKYRPVFFTYKALSLTWPVPYKWGITVCIYRYIIILIYTDISTSIKAMKIKNISSGQISENGGENMSGIIAQSFFHYWRFRHNIVSLQGSTIWGTHTVYFFGFCKGSAYLLGDFSRLFSDQKGNKRNSFSTAHWHAIC